MASSLLTHTHTAPLQPEPPHATEEESMAGHTKQLAPGSQGDRGCFLMPTKSPGTSILSGFPSTSR